MSSTKVQPAGCNRLRGMLKLYLKAGSFLFLLLSVMGVQAQWQDPLHSPSYKTDRAHEALLLDVTRAGARLVAVGAYGHIVYSDDNGLTWTQAEVPVTLTLTSVHFVDGRNGWAAGHDGIILNTVDGGQSWKKQFDGFSANQEIVESLLLGVQEAEAALAEAEEGGHSGAIAEAQERLEILEFKLDDAQYDLETDSTKPFLNIWFYDAKRGFVVGAYGMIFQTEDGGASWKNIASRLPNAENYHLNSLVPVGASALMVTGERGLIMRSDDFGKSWHLLDSPYEGSLFGAAAAGNKQLIYGLRGNVFYTADGGITWAAQEIDNEQTLLGGLLTRDRVFLVGNGGVLIEFDASMQKSKVHHIEGGMGYSGIAQAVDGTLVVVGESGIERLDAKVQSIHQAISMAAVGGN